MTKKPKCWALIRTRKEKKMKIKNFLVDTPFEFQIAYECEESYWGIGDNWKEVGKDESIFHYHIDLGHVTIAFG